MTHPLTRPSADPTREAILVAAQQCFIKTGFAGTSISTIAKAADINQSLIYHHFGSKLDLWVAVKNHILEAYQAQQDMSWEKLLTINNIDDFISEFIHYRFGLFDRYPDVLRIIEWQYLEPNVYDLTSYQAEKISAMLQHIANFQQQNNITSKQNPELILTLLLTIPLGFFRGFKDLSENKSPNELAKLKTEYIQLCINTLAQGLLA